MFNISVQYVYDLTIKAEERKKYLKELSRKKKKERERGKNEEKTGQSEEKDSGCV